MLENNNIIAFAIALIGLLQAGFLFLVLRNEGTSAWHVNRWMMVFLLAVSASFLRDIILLFGGTAIALILEPVLFSAYFALGPSMYLYFRELSGHSHAHPWKHFLILPCVCLIAAVMVGIVFIHHGDGILSGSPLHITFANDLLASVIATGLLIGLFVFAVCYHVALSRCIYASARSLKRAGDHHSMMRRRWGLNVVLCLHTVLVAFILSQVFQLAASDMHWSTLLINVCFVLTLLRLSFLLASQPFRPGRFGNMAMLEHGNIGPSEYFTAALAKQTVRHDHRPEVSTASCKRPFVDEDVQERICRQLDRLVADNNTLFDPLMTMPKLAGMIGVTPNQLSFTLNNRLGQSFFEFINTVRVRAAAALLLAEPHRTILDIATEVGFNSKSTFNLAFKKITGRTPSVYRREHGG
ncbi:AraC family transcriptional regulator [Thalassospira australica]|uniref:AraC family transcriptional regulator n=1 Tax=Thalassospira australica TaxID=1528106 RepID=UPI00068B63A0|nr:helix-turn-helix domain-containing protein [Thalassospira australica]